MAAGNAEPPNAGTKTKVGVTRAQARSQAPKSAELLASAVFAVLSLLEEPLRGVTVASVSQSTQLARQVFGTLFSLAPVWLVVYRVRR